MYHDSRQKQQVLHIYRDSRQVGKEPVGAPSFSVGQFLYQLGRHKMILIMVGGAVGTCARYWLSRWCNEQSWGQGFPYGTLIINVSGSFVLAMAAVLFLDRLQPEYQDWYLLVGVGFCGGYTTFSTFEMETFRLVQDGSWHLALVNVVVSVLAGFVGVILGVTLARFLFAQ
jgi:fluoride exporter